MIADRRMVPALLDANNLLADGCSALKEVVFHIGGVAINQAAVAQVKSIIPYDFEVVDVTAYSRALVANATIDVQVNAVTILTGLFAPGSAAGAPTRGALVATRKSRRGTRGQVLSVLATTDGTGTLTELTVVVRIRPYPAAGEAYGT